MKGADPGLLDLLACRGVNVNMQNSNGDSPLSIAAQYGRTEILSVLLQYGKTINPRRACAARVTVVGLCVCLFVCLSVDDYSRTTGYEAAYERYQQLQCYKGMKINVAILLKRLRSSIDTIPHGISMVREIWRENKRKSQYA